MNTLRILITGLLLISPVAASEEINQYDGTWHVEMITPKGKTQKGTVLLTNNEGTWDIVHTKVKNPCKGRPAPIVINEASTEILVFVVQKSKALMGCNDFTVTLKPISETTLEGESNDGRKVTLIKK